jgi:hypothetical protein
MKIISRFYLILFIAFLTTPTIVTLVEKSCDTSFFFSLSEEEHAKHGVKFFVTPSFSEPRLTQITGDQSSLILSENLSKHDKIATSVFSPPPNLV